MVAAIFAAPPPSTHDQRDFRMTSALTRRAFVAVSLGATLYPALPTAAQTAVPGQPGPDAATMQAKADLAALEAAHGGRLGVAALDTGSGRRVSYRAGERFAMCSTTKVLTASAILTMVEQGRLQLDSQVHYRSADLLAYAPITRKNVATGFMTVDALCAAAIEWSDNTAENLLLGLIGGPAGWTRYARSIGDTTSRLDRTEPTLNTAIPGDPRDTTTPGAMLRDLHVVLLGAALNEASRQRLENWMLGNAITSGLLRAGVPNGWRVGDKSGSGDHATRNDIGIILPPRSAPILAAVYFTGSPGSASSRDQVIADVGRTLTATFPGITG
jgi:beta-lactamase class A